MLATRPPTGEAGWPNLLIEGKEGAGKTYAALRFTADPRIGSAYVIECGERRADEYAALGHFRIVDHDGTLPQIVDAISEVLALPPLEGRPNVLIIDSLTGLWDLVKREAETIARSSKAAREILAKDPHAHIDVKHQAWNRAKDPYWWRWLNQLRAWQGITLVTGRADEVSKFIDGRPVANQTEYRVEIEQGTPFILDGTVRMRVGKPPLVTTAKSLRFTVPENGLVIDDDEALAHVVFDLFGAGEQVTLSQRQAMPALAAYARALGLDTDHVKAACRAVWEKYAGDATEFDGALMSKLTDALEVEVAAIEQAAA